MVITMSHVGGPSGSSERVWHTPEQIQQQQQKKGLTQVRRLFG